MDTNQIFDKYLDMKKTLNEYRYKYGYISDTK
jgi:hypothetical protein